MVVKKAKVIRLNNRASFMVVYYDLRLVKYAYNGYRVIKRQESLRVSTFKGAGIFRMIF